MRYCLVAGFPGSSVDAEVALAAAALVWSQAAGEQPGLVVKDKVEAVAVGALEVEDRNVHLEDLARQKRRVADVAGPGA